MRWTKRKKYDKIPYRCGIKRENENFRNRSGIVYLESSFDMISIKHKEKKHCFSSWKYGNRQPGGSRENENCFTNKKYVL